MNLAFSNEIKLKAENSAPVPGFAHTKLNLLLLEQRKRAEQYAIRTEMRIADVGRLPVSDEALSVVLCALFDDAVHVASESERKYLYTAILVRSGQLLISMKASAGKISSPNEAADFADENRAELSDIKEKSEKIGGNFVCSSEKGMICYTFCLGLFN